LISLSHLCCTVQRKNDLRGYFWAIVAEKIPLKSVFGQKKNGVERSAVLSFPSALVNLDCKIERYFHRRYGCNHGTVLRDIRWFARSIGHGRKRYGRSISQFRSRECRFRGRDTRNGDISGCPIGHGVNSLDTRRAFEIGSDGFDIDCRNARFVCICVIDIIVRNTAVTSQNSLKRRRIDRCGAEIDRDPNDYGCAGARRLACAEIPNGEAASGRRQNPEPGDESRQPGRHLPDVFVFSFFHCFAFWLNIIPLKKKFSKTEVEKGKALTDNIGERGFEK
jgi:hypothetical protein